jgi:hypothetical protein
LCSTCDRGTEREESRPPRRKHRGTSTLTKTTKWWGLFYRTTYSIHLE